MRCDYYDCRCSLDDYDDDEIHIVTVGRRSFHLCPDCHEAHDDDDLYECPDCGYLTDIGDAVRGQNMREAVCYECYNENYYTCARCGDAVYRDDSYWCEECQRDYCSDCYEQHMAEYHRESQVCGYHSHTYDVPPSDVPYLGVELEMGNTDEEDMIACSSEIEECYGSYFNQEDDGSIRDYGFETISKPFTWEWWYKHRNMVSELYSTFNQYGMEPHHSCGFHIHITKKFLPALTWRAMQWFISKNQHLFETLAGREENDWVDYNRDDVDDDNKEAFWFHQDDTHYAALSLKTSKRVTAEFRIFAPVDNVDGFFNHLSIVQGLYEWCKENNPLIDFHMVEMPRRAVYDWYNWNKKRIDETKEDKALHILHKLVNEQLEDAMKACGY